ncbi:MAG: family 10 glycosylhydrolase [Planctomycetes bacterium]|nr:family 10 glycosylhydrolase [Planctomycetota bacterium]
MKVFRPDSLDARTASCWLRSLLVMGMILIAGVSTSVGEEPEDRVPLTTSELRHARKQKLRTPRRIIANNDGCDCLYFPKDLKPTVANFLAQRTTDLAGTQVDTIAYCTISSGFSYFTHKTRVGTLLSHSASDFGIAPDKRNIARELIAQGTDPLRAVVDFGHRHNMEVFWSMRMNDTHDVAHHPDRPYFLFPPLKKEHPEWLVGDPIRRTPYGRWSSVDYARPEIRDLAFRFIAEVCTSYDVDGIELDFFRHLCFFKSTAFGKAATDDERFQMTDLLRRVRRMTEQVGCRRGKPILVAVRVPDSVEYCRDMGLDLERWLQEGLIDLLITTGYFRLNPWTYTVQLAHRYGVAAYPCLSDSRVRGESRFRRASLEGYRGRAMNAWAAGADGIHIFNFFDPKAQLWRELGDPRTLLAKDKLYFVTVRDGNPNSFLAGGDRYCRVPVLTPSHAARLVPGRQWETELTMGEDVADARRAGFEPEFTLHLELPYLKQLERLQVKWNGQVLADGHLSSGWADYPVPADSVRKGTNRIELLLREKPGRSDEWNIVYEATERPRRPWQRDRGSPRTLEKLTDGALFLADRGTVSGDYLFYRYAWGATPDAKTVVEAQVKVISGASYVIVANGITGERLELWPDHIDLYHHRSIRYDMDTTDRFHLYRIEMEGEDLKVYVDGQLRLDATGKFSRRSGYPRNEFAFGAANSTMVGEALWASVKARVGGQILTDVVMSVRYRER